MTRHHLTDTELISLCFERPAGLATTHLATCGTCQARQLAVGELIGEATSAATAEADAAFPADALTRQHGRIMDRAERETRPAKVISFPAAEHGAAPVRYTRTGSRWVAAAVAAGVILGLAGEHITYRLTRSMAPRATLRQAAPAVAPDRGVAVRAIATTGSDDEFLGQVELAFDSAGPAMLRPLDALTPRAWDIRE